MNAALIIVLITASTVLNQSQGQTRSQSGRSVQDGGTVGVYGYGYPVYGYYGGATSGAGERLRGMADLIRAQGEALGQLRLQTAQAAAELEEAKARNMENQKRATEMYFEKRRLHQEYQAAEVEAQRQRAAARRAAAGPTKSAIPPRPNMVEVDPVTGQVRWPKVLTDDRFTEVRSKLDRMFEDRAAADGFIGAEASDQIEEAVQAMREQLREHIKAFSSQDYIDAAKFLDSLERECRFAGK